MRPPPSVFVPAASHTHVHLPVRQPSLDMDDCDPRGCKWRPPGSASAGFDAHDMTVLIILLCALICVVALHSAIRCFLRGGSSDPLQSNPGPYESTEPAQKLAEDRALTVAYSSGLGLAAAECAICLTEFEEGAWVRVLERCRHSFHVECIQRWLSSHTSCPNCRSSCFPPPRS